MLPPMRLRTWLLCLALLGAAAAAADVPADSPEAAAAAPEKAEPPPTGAPAPRPVLREDEASSWAGRGQSLLGIFALLGIGFALSGDRRRIPWRVVGVGTALQLVFAVLVLKTSPGRAFFGAMNDAIVAHLDFTQEGSAFLFRSFVTGKVEPGLVSFTFNVLPTIVFFSSLMTVLYHLGLVQRVVSGLAWLMQRTMRTSGAETLSTAGNIFLGQTEAPLLVKPYVARMTRSELYCVMVGGMSSTAGGVMAAYVGILKGAFPDIAGHLLAASVLSAPATLVFSKLILPETETPETHGVLGLDGEKVDANAIDAAARGASEGLQLAFNVAAMLLAFIALLALLNAGLGWLGGLAGFPQLSFQVVAGWAFWPFAFLMGVPPAECAAVGQLLGEKVILNEFVAYAHLGDLLRDQAGALGYRGVTVATYALSGFANFSSIAIQIGGIGSLAPSRRGDIARLGVKAVIGGSLASFMTAAVAGLLL